MTNLLESEFLTVDIRSVLGGNSEPSEKDTTAEQQASKQPDEGHKTAKQPGFDWSAELKQRLAKNKTSSPEARLNEYDIETKFFTDFFNEYWDTESVKQLLLMGQQLRHDIKVLGFNFKINPILAFLSLSYVRKNLLQTALLNVHTYKAIHNAVALKQVADSEFFKENKYNIIYCRDLYKKSLREIQDYLELQKSILPPSASVYTPEMQANNKKVFIYSPKNKAPDIDMRAETQKNLATRLPSVQNESTKLNSYDLAEKIANKFTGRGNLNLTNATHRRNKSSKALKELADKITTPAQILACIQYLSIATGDTSISKALSNKALNEVSMIDLKAATAQIASFLPQAKLSKDDAIALVDMLI
jgi:hypothetical protein